jgi:hypothetical protein
LSDDECRVRLKEYLVAGLGLRKDDPEGKRLHMDLKARASEVTSTEAELDGTVDNLVLLVDGPH